MKNKIITGIIPTGIGSVPHKDVNFITRFILDNFRAAPFSCQLPKLSFMENMYVQYSEGLPGVVINKKEEKIFADLGNEKFTELLTSFYDDYLNNNLSRWELSEEHSAGFNKYFELAGKTDYFKTQLTGPITYGLKLTDKSNKSVFFDSQYQDVLIKHIVQKVKWLANKLRGKNKENRIIVFFDEPYMASFGSAFIPVTKEDVLRIYTEILQEVKREGIITGIHCCGNTDWSVLIDTGIDIINLDAYNFGDGLILYIDKIKEFLERGSVFAFGIVPSGPEIDNENLNSLTDKLNIFLNRFEEKGIGRKQFLDGMLITPSCGLGSISEEMAERILKMTVSVSKNI